MTQEASLREIKKFDFIDALRGWAILAVLALHVGMQLPPSLFSPFAERGWIGVQLFFIVSALTLFFSFHARGDEKNCVKAFWIRRFFRIVPMFWIAIFFYMAINGFHHFYWYPQKITAWRILSTVFLLNGWSPLTVNNVVPGGWSIAVEMNFYLLVPFFYKYVNSLRKALLCFFAALAFSILANALYGKWLLTTNIYVPLIQSFLYYWLPNQLPVFFLGIVLFFLLRDHLAGEGIPLDPDKQKTDTRFAWILIGLGFLCFAAGWLLGDPRDLYQRHLPFGLGFLYLAWALALRPFPFFVNRFMCYMGKVSYSSYLIHFFIADLIMKAFARIGPRYNLSSYPEFCFLGVFLATLAVTLGVSTLTYTWIEQPFQTFGKKIIRKYL